MRVKAYEKLSDVYNGLMKSVDYKNWSQYILRIAEGYLTKGSNVLELAAGNLKMADLITVRYKNFIGTDKSLSMLKSAENKKLMKVCCDMTALPLKSKFDFVFSAFDSINYILTQKSLLKLFSEVNLILSGNGIFTFDVSLEKNSRKFIIEKTAEDFYNGYLFQRINHYNQRSRIHYNRFIITNNSGSQVKEVHKQKIYDINTFFKLAEKSGLHTDFCYDCFTLNDSNPESERVQFVMRKVSR